MERKTILLVEDNPDDQELTRLAFAKHNLQNDLVIANDGVEAIEYLFGSEGQEDPDPRPLPAVVLLDLKLPRVDGLEVLRRHPGPSAHPNLARGRTHLVAGRPGCGCQLFQWRQQLHPQAG